MSQEVVTKLKNIGKNLAFIIGHIVGLMAFGKEYLTEVIHAFIDGFTKGGFDKYCESMA